MMEHWDEFVKFWRQCGETPTWIDFVTRSHNLHWFVTYVFVRYPETMKRAMQKNPFVGSSTIGIRGLNL